MTRPYKRKAFFSVLTSLVALAASGCDEGGSVRLIPIYPADEQTLLDDAGVNQILVDLYAAEDREGTPARSLTLTRGEKIHFDDIGLGPWIIVVRGLDGVGDEVVFGETHPFRIDSGEATEVRVFIGRSSAFNFAELKPAEVASNINGLMGHTATPFTDEAGEEWILVTGGYLSGGNASADAYLINPSELTVEKLDAKMSRPRSQHSALAIEPPGRAPLVVIADDSSSPITSLEVYDTAERLFRTIEVPCGPSSFSGMAAALTPDLKGELVPSGRVILPGAVLCVVDPYGTQGAETWPSPTETAPQAPATSVSNAAGQILVVDAQGSVWATSAIERSSGIDVCGGLLGDYWENMLAARRGATLTAVGESDRFALIGGSSPLGGNLSNDWAIIELETCEILSAVEGASGNSTVSNHPVVLDLSQSSESAPAMDLVVTSGIDEKRADSACLLGDEDSFMARAAVSHPVWYSEHGARTPALRAARSGQAIVRLSNRSAWVIGGGGIDAEIFELGAETAGFAATSSLFSLRKPVLTAMTVLDYTDNARDLMALLQDTDEGSYLGTLFEQQTSATVCLFGDANRGIGDSLKTNALPDIYDACDSRDGIEYASAINGVVVANEEEESSIDMEDLVDADQSNALNTAQQMIASAMTTKSLSSSSVENILVNTPRALPTAEVDDPTATDAVSCQWRQYTRVGFDGLGYEGSNKDATYPGVNVLVWMVTGDDCSQGWYRPNDSQSVYGATDTAELPPDTSLATTECGDLSMDAYFDLPPTDPDERSEMKDTIRNLVWDPRDLIVAVVRQGTSGSTLPRRVDDMIRLLDEVGAQFVDMTIQNPSDEAEFSEKVVSLSERIAARNPYQICVPADVIDGLAAPYADDVGDKGLFLPVDDGDPWNATLLSNIENKVRRECRVLRVTAAEDGSNRTTITELEGGWRIATDSDLRAGCSTDSKERSGWTVQIDASSVADDDAVFLQCKGE